MTEEELILRMTEDEDRRFRRATTENQKQQILQEVANRIGVDMGITSKAKTPSNQEIADAITPSNVTDATQVMVSPSDLINQVASGNFIPPNQQEQRKVLFGGSPISKGPKDYIRMGSQLVEKREVDSENLQNSLVQSFLSEKPVNGVSYNEVKNLLVSNGVVVPDAKFESVLSMWKTWTGLASTVYDNGNGPKLTIQELINNYGNAEGKAAAASFGIGTGPATTTTTTYTEYDVESALDIAESAYGKKLGRRPSKKQIQNVVEQLNKKARLSPSVATTTRGGAGSTTVSYGGGFSPTRVAERVAETDPLYAETDFVTNFLPIIESVFKNPISGSM